MINKNLNTSGKTVIDAIITISYFEYVKKCNKITANKDLADDLLHYVVNELYYNYDLNKLSLMTCGEKKRVDTYIMRMCATQWYSWQSGFNKKYRHHQDYTQIDLSDNISLFDDIEDVRKQKTIEDIKYDCLYKGLEHIEINPPHKKYFYKYLLDQVLIYKKNINEIARELQIPKGIVYRNYGDLRCKLLAYTSEKCKDL